MRSGDASGENGRGVRFYGYGLHGRVVLFQSFSRSADGTSRTYAGYEEVHFSVCVVPYFFCCGLYVCFRIGRVVELSRNEGSGMSRLQFFGPADGSLHAFAARSEYQCGT